jgi:DNA-binding transcriptional MerR regulator
VVDKAPDAFRTISEVASDLDVPQHVLRFWESRFREIKPMKRGGGRRYYRPDDIELLRGIRHLLYGEGYTIRGVQRILREQGPKFVQAVWHPGAPRPTHGPAEDGDNGAEENDVRASEPREGARGRGLFGLLPSLLGEDAQDPTPSPPPLAERPESQGEPRPLPSQRLVAPVMRRGNSLSAEDARRLKAVLHELAECRKLIDAALAPAT